MKKLLIVDDESEIRDFLSEFFIGRKYTVVTAATKEDAYKALQEEKPHVALLDVRMKGPRDGIEILHWIKEQKLTVKIIMVTAVEARDIIQETASLGANDYITKPLSLEYLETCVAQKIATLMTE
ncbi:MAG: hypothetical protein A3G33_02720 [Omnitrophica bacterium RIFCSPLOWO2_12_FULL_44_17]|uniref:Response regulatory domain-containing protein n=1 Tax=Candidatus Danuiimicrobium aquiferis TaxID=1801832 RepID=A0A1G1KYB2_9BACT|nr:MAG: hypothetical protein A3E74_06070 [Omnitrophica bacterium RIFCSPHIGHO2_12_FULL_44_12]OGW97896.1 MAG: hypothetical protein A3G33_02720 [Omnitrophica bacterium RIFCSPLOWO2_12_FULL_44_17]OGX02829.1 MAG: hypothetical protein A3J12_00115 [Omnitrophica bacterium RIFCSPLOWO2_02_FULL_44_11]